MHTQRDALRLIVHVRKVWLAVRFHCKLAFMLKNGTPAPISRVLRETSRE